MHVIGLVRLVVVARRHDVKHGVERVGAADAPFRIGRDGARGVGGIDGCLELRRENAAVGVADVAARLVAQRPYHHCNGREGSEIPIECT